MPEKTILQRLKDLTAKTAEKINALNNKIGEISPFKGLSPDAGNSLSLDEDEKLFFKERTPEEIAQAYEGLNDTNKYTDQDKQTVEDFANFSIEFDLQETTNQGATTDKVIEAAGYKRTGSTSDDLLEAGGGAIPKSTFATSEQGEKADTALQEETDPTVPSWVKAITEQNLSDFQSAYNWGNHSEAGYELQANKGQANGYAPLDTGAKISETYLPDSILGQVSYQGTWDAANNTPAIPTAASANKGWYFIASSSIESGHGYPNVPNTDFKTGDWIISNGSSWAKVDNSDSVSTVFGRLGNIVANEADYEAFYPKLSATYANPSWINSLAFSKITGVPNYALDADVLHKAGAERVTGYKTFEGGFEVKDVAANKKAILSANGTYVAYVNGTEVHGKFNFPSNRVFTINGGNNVVGVQFDMTDATTQPLLKIPNKPGTIALTNDLGNYEPSFTKNSAFNKNFGTTAGTVAEGNQLNNYVSKIVGYQTIRTTSTGASEDVYIGTQAHATNDYTARFGARRNGSSYGVTSYINVPDGSSNFTRVDAISIKSNTIPYIGVGIDNPQSILDVYRAGSVPQRSSGVRFMDTESPHGITITGSSYNNTSAEERDLFTIRQAITDNALTNIYDFEQDYKQVFKIAANGNVGIGISNPQAKLDIAGKLNITTTEAHALTFNRGSHSTILGIGSDGQNYMIAGGTGVAYAHPNSNFGIGISVPEYKLDVNGTVRANVFIGSGAQLINIPQSAVVNLASSLSARVPVEGAFTINGTKTFSSSPVVPTPTLAAHAASKEYVDNNAEKSQIQRITEGSRTGYRLLNADPYNYGNIGIDAVDFSNQTSASSVNGATGTFSVAFGSNTQASGHSSFVAGRDTVASAQSSIALGDGSQATGLSSIAMGSGSIASQTSSIAIGANNQANGAVSFAFGSHNIANGWGEVVLGAYNEEGPSGTASDTFTKAFDIGIGGLGSRKSAFTIYRNGAAMFHPVAKSTLGTPKAGMLISNSESSNRLEFFNGSVWQVITVTAA